MKKGSGFFLKIVPFSLSILFVYTAIANVIPQQESRPPEESVIDFSKIKTKQDLVKAGQSIFFGKGKCSLCHSIGPSATARCPDLSGMGGKLTREFLYESLTEPSKYIYMDYEVSPPKRFGAVMPTINRPPVDLSEQEVLLVISFLQKLGGEVTVDPSEIIKPVTVKTEGMPEQDIFQLIKQGDSEKGRGLFEKMSCSKCHNPEKTNWSAILTGKDANSIRMSIFNVQSPSGKKFHDTLSQVTLDDINNLVSYLMTLKGNVT
ncbi:MAG: hypothetical protein A2W77_00145 [Nitrospinae bacterium RIFCSPLOWO2_12_39_16]|nr:MAG: hypothetical protein A2Z59_05880 [Nitrospinae bacterium RIFCSPLOWO2_02_39_17]OGW13494.1 MAG: hypothetical protein A2W77_00145 [Nitrospinae bacterium RIFCSPLOWO2_12_39_16]